MPKLPKSIIYLSLIRIYLSLFQKNSVNKNWPELWWDWSWSLTRVYSNFKQRTVCWSEKATKKEKAWKVKEVNFQMLTFYKFQHRSMSHFSTNQWFFWACFLGQIWLFWGKRFIRILWTRRTNIEALLPPSQLSNQRQRQSVFSSILYKW